MKLFPEMIYKVWIFYIYVGLLVDSIDLFLGCIRTRQSCSAGNLFDVFEFLCWLIHPGHLGAFGKPCCETAVGQNSFKPPIWDVRLFA